MTKTWKLRDNIPFVEQYDVTPNQRLLDSNYSHFLVAAFDSCTRCKIKSMFIYWVEIAVRQNLVDFSAVKVGKQ